MFKANGRTHKDEGSKARAKLSGTKEFVCLSCGNKKFVSNNNIEFGEAIKCGTCGHPMIETVFDK